MTNDSATTAPTALIVPDYVRDLFARLSDEGSLVEGCDEYGHRTYTSPVEVLDLIIGQATIGSRFSLRLRPGGPERTLALDVETDNVLRISEDGDL